ncbi:hypothetical protein CHS0354_033660 [Potamilus streckersoni]|uniref:Uncharacterized protein n=1 Tax=Potamilus streckersoni TaxID=2493646 RepID=A0AAE0S252_9BIVA|nr:hypothetical protein CHS0354_033660 [Potamilus streckersoni]
MFHLSRISLRFEPNQPRSESASNLGMIYNGPEAVLTSLERYFYTVPLLSLHRRKSWMLGMWASKVLRE